MLAQVMSCAVVGLEGHEASILRGVRVISGDQRPLGQQANPPDGSMEEDARGDSYHVAPSVGVHRAGELAFDLSSVIIESRNLNSVFSACCQLPVHY